MQLKQIMVLIGILSSVCAFPTPASHALEKRTDIMPEVTELIVPHSLFKVNDIPYVLPKYRPQRWTDRLYLTKPKIDYKDEANNIAQRQWLVAFRLGDKTFIEDTNLLDKEIENELKQIIHPEDQIAYLRKIRARENKINRKPAIATDVQLLIESYILKAQYQIITKRIEDKVAKKSSIALASGRKLPSMMDHLIPTNGGVAINTQMKLEAVNNEIKHTPSTFSLNPFETARMTTITQKAQNMDGKERLAYLEYMRTVEPSKEAHNYLYMKILIQMRTMFVKEIEAALDVHTDRLIALVEKEPGTPEGRLAYYEQLSKLEKSSTVRDFLDDLGQQARDEIPPKQTIIESNPIINVNQ